MFDSPVTESSAQSSLTEAQESIEINEIIDNDSYGDCNQNQDYSSIDKNALNAFPDCVSFVRIGKKKNPLDSGWQDIKLAVNQVCDGSTRTKGVGVNLGKISGGLVAIDFDALDGSGALESFIEKYIPNPELPQTVTVTSGKPGRRSLLYFIPECHWTELKGKTFLYSGNAEWNPHGKPSKIEQIEFRWDGHQQVVTGYHPETGGYRWINSPTDTAIAQAPDWVIDALKGKYQALADEFKPKAKQPKPKPKKRTKPKGFGGTNQVLANDERNRRLALEILDQLPMTEDGAGNYYDYRDFSWALKYIIGENEAIEAMYRHSPNRDWKQIIPSNTEEFGMGTVIKIARDYIPGWDYPDWWKKSFPKNTNPYYLDNDGQRVTVESKPHQEPVKKQSKDWQKELKSLAYSDLPTDELNRKMAQLIADEKISEKIANTVYASFLNERLKDESKEETKTQLNQLIAAHSDTIDLELILPGIIAKLIKKLANDIGLRPETYLTAFLPAASSCLDPRLKITLNRRAGFVVGGGIYGSMVAHSSQGKSPITNEIIGKPFKVLQRELHTEYKEKMTQYQRDYQAYQIAIKNGEEAEEPVKPNEVLMDISNFTVEALKDKLAYQQDKKGILATFDELAGLFAGLNQYKGGRGSDKQELLSFYDGNGFSVARKSGDIRAENCLLSIFGGIQPEILKGLLNSKSGISDGDGQWARFIFCNQPPTPILLPDDDDEPCTVATELIELYRNLMSIGERHLTLSTEARLLFNQATKPIEHERVELEGHPLANALGKQRGRIGKFCSLLHCIDYAMGDRSGFDPVVSVDVMRRALALNKFYDSQLRSLYAQLDTSNTSLAPDLLKLIELKNKGTITIRDASRKLPKRNRGDVLALMTELSKLGYGDLIEVKPTGGGRPTLKFEFRQSFDSNDSFDRVLTEPYAKTQNHTQQGFEVNKNSFDSFDIEFHTSQSPNQPQSEPDKSFGNVSGFDTVTYDKTVKTVKTPKNETQQGFEPCQNSCQNSVKTPSYDKTHVKTPRLLTVTDLDGLVGPTEVTLINKSDGFIYPGVFSGFTSGVGTFQPTEEPNQSPIPVTRKSVSDGKTELWVDDDAIAV